MAREAIAPANERGLRAGAPVAVYASAEVHMSIPKAVALLGIGRENLRLIPVDDSFRMIPAQLEAQLQRDKHLGIIPVAVVVTAGTVSTGAIDPLPQISEIAAKYGAWLHVDGAYGALGAIALPEKFQGLDLANSVSLDPHKWFYQPIDCGCLLYRDASAAHRAFAHSGDYVRALKLWFSLRYHGFAAIRKSIEKDLSHARRLADSITKEPALGLLAPVELSAVCFRYVGKKDLPEAQLNQLNLDILKRVVARGRVYLSNATLHSKFCLRACIVNHRTTDADIDAIPAEVLCAAQDILSGTDQPNSIR
jgi:aromatic-L-amino-acid/L-tryptophan decarboxylase